MKTGLLLMAIVAVVVAFGCRRKDTHQASFNENEILKIAVSKSGEIRANDTSVTLVDLDRLLGDNGKKNGVVWYYREAGQEDPPPQAKQVIELVFKHRRPISMSSKPDFSDTIDEKGNSRLRE